MKYIAILVLAVIMVAVSAFKTQTSLKTKENFLQHRKTPWDHCMENCRAHHLIPGGGRYYLDKYYPGDSYCTQEICAGK